MLCVKSESLPLGPELISTNTARSSGRPLRGRRGRNKTSLIKEQNSFLPLSVQRTESANEIDFTKCRWIR